MLTDQCLSVSELRKNFNSHLKDLKNGSKVIFINNKPVAVLSSINNFDLHIGEPFAFSFPE
jgi:hypothetical protein